MHAAFSMMQLTMIQYKTVDCKTMTIVNISKVICCIIYGLNTFDWISLKNCGSVVVFYRKKAVAFPVQDIFV